MSILILLYSPSQAQAPLELSKMSDSDKNKTGLYKLSDAELKSLENWLNKKQSDISVAVKQNNAGFESKQYSERKTIETTLKKRYKDVLGNTFYQLTNEQVWKQVQSGNINVKSGSDQIITIEPKMMGSWMLKGNGNRGVKVKRIR